MERPAREECAYTEYYCEENVWQLCKRHFSCGLGAYVIFISNKYRRVPLWSLQQSCGKRPVLWDYHVICVHGSDRGSDGPFTVYDLDSRLPWGTPFPIYAERTFCPDIPLKPEFEHSFRIVPAERYIAAFASDRSHMRGRDGSWASPPPAWVPIQTEACAHNLHDFLDMSPLKGREPSESISPQALLQAVRTGSLGAVVSLSELLLVFGRYDVQGNAAGSLMRT